MKYTKFLGIDFDGTIVFNEFPRIGNPVPGAIEWIRYFRSKKIGIILYTVRTEKFLDDAIIFLKDKVDILDVNNNPYRANPGKLDVTYYIDDRAIGTPLIHDLHRKPYVDWRIVGPMTKKLLKLK